MSIDKDNLNAMEGERWRRPRTDCKCGLLCGAPPVDISDWPFQAKDVAFTQSPLLRERKQKLLFHIGQNTLKPQEAIPVSPLKARLKLE
jgi:hypothetical protein